MTICQICGKVCASNAGLGQHIAYMHGPKSDELRNRRANNAKGRVPSSKGKTKDDLPYLARPQQKGKPFGISLTGHTDETKRKISESMKGNQNAHHRGDRQSHYNGIRMDSKWEVGVARYFDQTGVSWRYNERGFQLSNGTYYYPDFFIYDGDEFVKLVEVKGYFREQNKQKFERFLVEYPDIKIELWQKEKLITLGIINRAGCVVEGIGG